MALESLKNLEKLGNAVGLYMTGKAQSAFRDQGRPAGAWAARAPINRMGILMDLRQGKVPPERRFQPRPAAIDTGALRSSITYRVSGNTVTVGTNVAYASDVQKGATNSVTIDSNLRKALASWLRSLSGARKDQMRQAFGYLFHVGVLTVTTPPRPFIVLTNEDKRQINNLARKYFAGGSQ